MSLTKMDVCRNLGMCVSFLVGEVAVVRKDERGTAAIGGHHHFVVADGSARCDDRGATAGNRGFEAVGKRKEAVARAGRAFGQRPGPPHSDLYGAHAIGLTGANSARRSLLDDDDAVTLDVPDDVPSKGEVVPLLRRRLPPADHPPLL